MNTRGETVWVVTKATAHSTLDDILFEVNAVDFLRQVRGGLCEADKPAFFGWQVDAREEAEARLRAAKGEGGASVKQTEKAQHTPGPWREARNGVGHPDEEIEP